MYKSLATAAASPCSGSKWEEKKREEAETSTQADSAADIELSQKRHW
jgi:hypothetical protein